MDASRRLKNFLKRVKNMNDIKEKVIVASCLMDEDETNQLWELILNNFPNYSWEHLKKIIFHSYDACAIYALQVLQAACLDDRRCWEYLSREKTIRDYNQKMFEAEERGRQSEAKRINNLNTILLQNKRYNDLERSANDSDFQRQLMREYNI